MDRGLRLTRISSAILGIDGLVAQFAESDGLRLKGLACCFYSSITVSARESDVRAAGPLSVIATESSKRTP